MKLTHLAAASVLTLSGLAVAAPAIAQQAPNNAPTAASPIDTAPDGATITLAGLGEITITVDPVTGEIQSVTVAPVADSTADGPVTTHEGLELTFTAADGSVRVVTLRTELDDGVSRITVETATTIPAEDDENHVGEDDEADDEREDRESTAPGSGSGSDHHSGDHHSSGPNPAETSDDGGSDHHGSSVDDSTSSTVDDSSDDSDSDDHGDAIDDSDPESDPGSSSGDDQHSDSGSSGRSDHGHGSDGQDD
ncbi:MAG: hypothetical protein KGR18_09970 [Acidobacteria bacterium]|nr:hypothetical protein [Acidobacteriota bacterium]